MLPNAGQDEERQKLSHSLLVGVQNGTTPLEDSLAVSYKTKHLLTIYSSSYTPSCLLKQLKTYCTQKLAQELFFNPQR